MTRFTARGWVGLSDKRAERGRESREPEARKNVIKSLSLYGHI